MAARLRILYAPKGPNLQWDDDALRRRVLDDLQQFARRQGGIFLKIDPDVPLGWGIPGDAGARENPVGAAVEEMLRSRGWVFSEEQIQFRNTVLVDISSPEEEILARMKQKTRYNIRLAARRGVSIREGTREDWTLLYKMYAETALRDSFTIRDEAYYRAVWENLSAPRAKTDAPCAKNLIAEIGGETAAALTLVCFGKRAYYLYGMSRAAYRRDMPAYLLQWEAIRTAKSLGCDTYDMWGAPEIFDERDSMWGVWRFKRGWGGEVLRTLGAWDYPSQRWAYALYREILPRFLDILRRRGKERTRRALR
jgi:lipid II:glycine glycyltransferase (peptidoglycan interpeptide bridge formation enzyme)